MLAVEKPIACTIHIRCGLIHWHNDEGWISLQK